MHFSKLMGGSALILLSLSVLLVHPLVMAAIPPRIQVTLEDVNGDGLKDLRFAATEEGLGVEGIRLGVFAGNSSGVPLIEGLTDSQGILTFYNMPGGSYNCVASDGYLSIHDITIPAPELSLTESEAVAWQTIVLNWIGESQNPERAFFEELSKFVGFNFIADPFPTSTDRTLREYSLQTYQWIDRLQNYIVGLDHSGLDLFSKMMYPFKEVAANFFADCSSGIDYSEIQTIDLDLNVTSAESAITYEYRSLYSDGQIAGYHELLKMSASEDHGKTITFPLELIIGAFQHQSLSELLNPEMIWNFYVGFAGESPYFRLIDALQMANTIIKETLQVLENAKPLLKDLITEIAAPLKEISDLLSELVGSMQQFTIVTVLLFMLFKWFARYPNLDAFLSALVQADPEILADLANLALGFAIALAVPIVLGLASLTMLSALAIVGGLLFAIFIWWWIAQQQEAQYDAQILVLRGNIGQSVTGLVKTRQELENINSTYRRERAAVYSEVADLMSKYADVAYQEASNTDAAHFFDSASSEFRVQSVKETEIADAVDNATDTIKQLLSKYTHWINPKDGRQINGHFVGYKATTFTEAPAGTKEYTAIVQGAFDQYDKIEINTSNLDGYKSNGTYTEILNSSVQRGWAYDPPVQTDSLHQDVQYAVFYAVNATNPIRFQIIKSGGSYSKYGASSAHLKEPQEYFYQYKFYFDDSKPEGTSSAGLVNDWLASLNQTNQIFQANLKRVQFALNSPVYEEYATSKNQTGTSWMPVSDLSSRSGNVMRAWSASTNGGVLLGPNWNDTMGGDNVTGMPYLGIFRLKVSSNTSPDVIGRLEVTSGYFTIQFMDIKATDFNYPDKWQDFILPFVVPKTGTPNLQFKIRNSNSGITDLFADKITVYRRWNLTTPYIEAAYTKNQTGWSWINTPDSSSLSGWVKHAYSSLVYSSTLDGPLTTRDLMNQSFAGKSFTATFRLKVSDNSSLQNVAIVSVAARYVGGTSSNTLKVKTIRAVDFRARMKWQDFSLAFTVPSYLPQVEFRVENVNYNITDVYVDDIEIEPGMPANPPTTYASYDGVWRLSEYPITLTAIDDTGIDTTYYRVNNGPIHTVALNGQPLITVENENNTLEYWSVDDDGNEEFPHKLLSDIKLDKTAPQGSILIDSGATYANTTDVNLTLFATDAVSGISQMCFQNEGDAWSDWELYKTSRIWTLPAGDGAKKVYVQYKDNANITVVGSDSIIIDMTPPIANAGQNRTVSTGENVSFSGAGSSDNYGIANYSWELGDGATGSGITATHTYTSSRNYTVTLTVQDAAGNTGTSILIVEVRKLGDVNGDLTVDKNDATILSNAFGATPDMANWNSNADINSDNIVDIYDAIILANHYGRHYL